MFPVQ